MHADLGFLAPMYPKWFLSNIPKPRFLNGFWWHFIKVQWWHRYIDLKNGRWRFAKNRIDSIYASLKKGADFGEMARKFSDDRATAARMGFDLLPSVNTMIHLNSEAFYLKKWRRLYIAPFKTALGYHIVKRISKKHYVSDYNVVKKSLMTKVGQNERFTIGKNSWLKILKKNTQFQIKTRPLISNLRILIIRMGFIPITD